MRLDESKELPAENLPEQRAAVTEPPVSLGQRGKGDRFAVLLEPTGELEQFAGLKSGRLELDLPSLFQIPFFFQSDSGTEREADKED